MGKVVLPPLPENVPPWRADYDQANDDHDQIKPYILEDPLQFLDGRKVTTVADWRTRRQEILDIFAQEMYGVEPPPPEKLQIDLIEENQSAVGGFAVRSQYRMTFPGTTGPAIDWLLIRPRHAKKKAPVIIFLNYHGNHQLLPDTEVIIPDMWVRRTPEHKPSPERRGEFCRPGETTVLPVGMLLSAGYAVLTACYAQISPDPDWDEPELRYQQDNFAYTGVFSMWGTRDEKRTDNTTAIGAWAWAISRGLDLAERIPELDVLRAVATGCSRLGKAALLASARDERFAVCCAIQCGGGGATLAKRDYGENIGTEMRMFKHWYCRAYKKYERNPAVLLPFDQHLLLTAVAPRKLLIGGFNEIWFDTEGEFIACQAASPVWELLGKPGLPANCVYPESYSAAAIGPCLGYYRRTEMHGIAAFDWYQIMRFAGDAGIFE